MLYTWSAFVICIAIIKHPAVVGISISIEVTHEEHFEASGIEEREFVQIYDQRLREELQHDEDILAYEKSYHEDKSNVTSQLYSGVIEETHNLTENKEFTHYSRNSTLNPNFPVIKEDLLVTKSYSLNSTKENFLNSSSKFTTDTGDGSSELSSVLDQLESSVPLFNSSLSSDNGRIDSSDKVTLSERADEERVPKLLEKLTPLRHSIHRGVANTILNSSRFGHGDKNRVDKTSFDSAKQTSDHVGHTPNEIISSNYTQNGTNYSTNVTKLSRDRRQVGFNVDELANADWELNYTTPKTKSPFEYDSFQVITANDKVKAEAQRAKKIAIYVGTSLLSVVGFSALAFCFIRDPTAFIIAFATGCPCCLLIVPCLRNLKESAEKKLKENVNKYMPGIIIHEDGRIEHYQTTPEEIEVVMDIIDEIQGM